MICINRRNSLSLVKLYESVDAYDLNTDFNSFAGPQKLNISKQKMQVVTFTLFVISTVTLSYVAQSAVASSIRSVNNAVNGQGHNQGRGRRNSAQAGNRQHRTTTITPTTTPASTVDEDSAQLYWLCPEVACAPVPDSCESIEFMVFEPEYWINGKRVVVSCRSCSYCLDVPEFEPFPVRNKRSVDSGASWMQNSVLVKRLLRRGTESKKCDTFQCPDVSSSCSDVQLTDVSLGHVTCRRHCPSCYDDIISTRFV